MVDTFGSGNGLYQGGGVAEVRGQLGLNNRSGSGGQVPDARAEVFADELIGGVGQSFFGVHVVLLFGGDSAGEQAGENLKGSDFGQDGGVLEVAGGFERSLARGFLGQAFFEIGEFGLGSAAGGDCRLQLEFRVSTVAEAMADTWGLGFRVGTRFPSWRFGECLVRWVRGGVVEFRVFHLR